MKKKKKIFGWRSGRSKKRKRNEERKEKKVWKIRINKYKKCRLEKNKRVKEDD